jgi:hypothetical protein
MRLRWCPIVGLLAIVAALRAIGHTTPLPATTNLAANTSGSMIGDASLAVGEFFDFGVDPRSVSYDRTLKMRPALLPERVWQCARVT